MARLQKQKMKWISIEDKWDDFREEDWERIDVYSGEK
jgi:hypothetical protein